LAERGVAISWHEAGRFEETLATASCFRHKIQQRIQVGPDKVLRLERENNPNSNMIKTAKKVVVQLLFIHNINIKLDVELPICKFHCRFQKL
jgi:hypothetical protein